MPKLPTDPIDFRTNATSSAAANAELHKSFPLQKQTHKSPQQIDKAAGGFEALLLHQMMKSMWQTVDKAGFLGDDSNQADIIQDMFTQSVSDEIAKGKGIGVKEVVKREIIKQQETSEKMSSELQRSELLGNQVPKVAKEIEIGKRAVKPS